MIVRMMFGAHLYGLATESSDRDYKGIFMPTPGEVLLGQIPRTRTLSGTTNAARNTAADVDEEHYSLHYFLELAFQGETVALDMLHAPATAILESSKTWEYLQANRSAFYTRRLRSLVAYARKQAAKYGVKGSRLAAAKQVQDLLRVKEEHQRLSEFWDDLPRNEYCEVLPAEKGATQMYSVCGKRFHDTVRVKHVLPVIEDFITRYGERARAAERSEGVDWKALSHALRAAYQVCHILRDGGFEYPLPETSILLRVKQGDLNYPVVADYLDAIMGQVELLAKMSDLPDKVDQAPWRAWLIEETRRSLSDPGIKNGSVQ